MTTLADVGVKTDRFDGRGTNENRVLGPGYFSWVCYNNTQTGGWLGPIPEDDTDDYEEGFALDNNIKSWTEFQYYEQKPRDPLTCNFSKRLPGPVNSGGEISRHEATTRNGIEIW